MKARAYIPELLDAGGAPPAEVARSLGDLRRINRWLGGRSVLIGILEKEVRWVRLRSFSLLDIGAGSGDLAAAAVRRFPEARIVLCDLKRQHLPRSGWSCVVASADALPFRDGSFDFVSASLLMHHFRDAVVMDVLKKFRRVARRAVLINDLERHWFPLLFIRLTSFLFARSYLTQHDAPASIRQAFRPEELRNLALAAGLTHVAVRRHWPWFRLSLVARNA